MRAALMGLKTAGAEELSPFAVATGATDVEMASLSHENALAACAPVVETKADTKVCMSCVGAAPQPSAPPTAFEIKALVRA